MNEHDRILALIPGYPELLTPERQKVDEHAQTCDECAAALQRQHRLRSELARAPRLHPDPAAAEAVRTAVSRRASPARASASSARRPRRLTIAAPAGALALILVLVGAWAVWQGWLPDAYSVAARPFGERLAPGAALVPGNTPTLPPFTPQPTHRPGVADLLANPPAAGQTVEVDAYFGGAGVPAMPGGPSAPGGQVVCPQEWNSALTDRPYPVALKFLNTTRGVPLPDDAPWLIAATPEQAQPGARSGVELPYHARLRGHLGDPAFAQAGCAHADRILVVDQVVKIYQQNIPDPSIYELKAPADYARWQRYADRTLGFSLPYPAGWQAQRLDNTTLSLRSAEWPGNPVVVRVHDGEMRYDQYEPAKLPPLLEGAQGWGQFRQGGPPYDSAGTQGLDGYQVQRYSAGATENAVSVLFAGNGRTYELALTYPIGFGASPALLSAYTAIVEGFRLDQLPGPTPTPPVNQELGAGPFLSEQEALSSARARASTSLDYLGGRLVSEAEARSSEQACSTFTGHPAGVWMLMVSGQFEGQKRNMRLLLDATNGEQLCGEEVQPGDTPAPSSPPGPTPTRVPSDTRLPTATLRPLPAGLSAVHLSIAADQPASVTGRSVHLRGTLTGGPDNSRDLYCVPAKWDFGDGQQKPDLDTGHSQPTALPG